MKKFILFFSSCLLLVSFVFSTKKVNALEQVPLIPNHILFGRPKKTHVCISPDGKKLAYLASCDGALNIWVKSLEKSNDYPITHFKRGISKFLWAKNNKHILFTQDKDGDEKYHIYRVTLETLEIVDMTPFKGITARFSAIDKNFPNKILITMNKENKKVFDVYQLDLMSGKLQLISKNPGNVDFWLSDAQLCIRAAVTAENDGSSTLLIRDNKDSKWIKKLIWNFEDSLVGSVPPKGSRPINFSSDGKFLYLIDSTKSNTQRLVKMNLITNEKKVLAACDKYDVDSVLINNDTYDVDFVLFIKDRKTWKALKPEFEKDLHIILSVNKGDLKFIDRSSDNMKWILGFENDNKPHAYYLYDRQTKNVKFLFYDKPILAKYKLAPMQPISFKSRDGLTIHGYLTCPLKKQKNLPLVLDVHGGPWLRDEWGYNERAQWFANRGVAHLQVNFRGSTGYGKKFMNAGDREWAGKVHNDLIDAVMWTIKKGIADPKKIAIFGESLGGYLALVGATFTPEVFCCAVSLNGPSNLVTMVNSIVSFRGTGRAKWHKRFGNPETDAEFLKSQSPLFKVDQIKIPIFISQAENDARIKQIEADQIVSAMQSKGIDYEYILFPNEGHRKMSPENSFKLLIAIEKFINKNFMNLKKIKSTSMAESSLKKSELK